MSSTTKSGMSSGSSLPLIFANGRPAALHNMSLPQLRKFAAFVVKCDCGIELSNEIVENSPPWWPEGVPFSTAAFTEKRPQKEMIQRLLNIISRCYAHHKSSYVIAFSTSLAENLSETKLTFVEYEDGTSKLLNEKKQLVVVIRTNTRFYDQEDLPKSNKDYSSTKRRSARLTRPDVNSNTDIVAADFKNSFGLSPRLTRLDDKVLQNQNNNNKRLNETITGRVVKDITNKIRGKNGVTKTQNKRAQKTKSSKKSSALLLKDDVNEALKCKHCSREFLSSYFHEDHEQICNISGSADIRDRSDLRDFFASTLGLKHKSVVIAESQQQVAPVIQTNIPSRAPVRNLRKVASRSKIGAFMRAHPLPITSLRGQQILEKFGERIKPQDGTPDYEVYCKSMKTRPPPCSASVTTMKKNILKPHQHAHTYSLGVIQRRIRGVELIMGMSTRSFKLFNKCKGCRVSLKPLTKDEVKLAKESENRRLMGKKGINLEKLLKFCSPKVKLKDFTKHPEVLPLKERLKYLKSIK